MEQIEALYLSTIAIGMCFVYIGVYFAFQLFLKKKIAGLKNVSMQSLLIVVMLSVAMYIVSFYVLPSKDIGNRFLHAFGGGFMVLFTCILAIRDSGVQVSKAVIFLTAGLLMMVLGLFNEIIEVLLQYHTGFLFAPSLADTLLDLMSNLIGFLIGSICLLPSMFSAYPSSRRRIAVRR
jgi:hypothetical protein